MKQYKVNMDVEKWLAQNKAEIVDFVEGCLLDSMLVYCKRGVAFLKETYINSNSSCYTLLFGAYGTDAENEVNAMWDQFADAVGVA